MFSAQFSAPRTIVCILSWKVHSRLYIFLSTNFCLDNFEIPLSNQILFANDESHSNVNVAPNQSSDLQSDAGKSLYQKIYAFF